MVRSAIAFSHGLKARRSAGKAFSSSLLRGLPEPRILYRRRRARPRARRPTGRYSSEAGRAADKVFRRGGFTAASVRAVAGDGERFWKVSEDRRVNLLKAHAGKQGFVPCRASLNVLGSRSCVSMSRYHLIWLFLPMNFASVFCSLRGVCTREMRNGCL